MKRGIHLRSFEGSKEKSEWRLDVLSQWKGKENGRFMEPISMKLSAFKAGFQKLINTN
jgi:hypothetical protein